MKKLLKQNYLLNVIYKEKYPVKVISLNCLDVNPFDLQKKIFFKLYYGAIYVAESISKLPGKDKYQLNKKAIDFYRSTGLIIPPTTLFKGIYRVPVGFKFCEIVQDFVLEKKLICEGEKTIDLLGEIIRNNYKYNEVNLLFSGGADSSLILYLLRKYNSKIKINSIFFNSGGIKEDFKRAKKLSNLLKSELKEIVPIKVDSKEVEKFIIEQTINLKELIYEPLLFTVNSIFKEIDDYSVIFDGQGADTVLGGLPHHLLIQIYKLTFIRFLSKVGFFSVLKNFLIPFKNKSRLFYRIHKLIISLNQKNISSCLLNSLTSGNNSFKNNEVFLMQERILNIYFNEYNETSAVSLFFLSIISSREIQKYKLNKKLIYCLPYLEANFIHHCLSIPNDFKCKFNKRKILIINYLNSVLPLKYSSSQQLPFEPHTSHVLSKTNKKIFDPLFKSKKIRDLSIKTLYKKYKSIK